MTSCDESSSLWCEESIVLFLIPLLALLFSLFRTNAKVNTRNEVFKGDLISFSEIFFGVQVSGSQEKVIIFQWIDKQRLFCSLTIAIFHFIYFLEDVLTPTSWIENLIEGTVPQLIFIYCLLKEIQTGSSERTSTVFYTLIALLAQILVLSLNSTENEDRMVQDSLFTFLYFVLYLLYGCINRDTRLLKRNIHSIKGTEYELLLDRKEQLDDFLIEEGEEIKVERTPEQYSGLLSTITFSWLNKLMKTGYERPLEEEDFYRLMRTDDSKLLSESFVAAFNELSQKANLKKTSTLNEEDINKVDYWLIIRSWHKSGILYLFYEAALFKIVYDTLNFVPPQMMKAIITFMTDTNETSMLKGLFFVGILFVSAGVQTIILHQYFHRVYRTGLRVRSALLTAIYQKSLRLSAEAKTKQTIGQIVNLMSTDTNRLQNLFSYLHISWSALYVIFLSTLFLWSQLKYAVFVAQGVVVLFIIPLTNFVSKKIKVAQKDVMKVKDERIKLTTETITSIKILKLYGWEKAFRGKVSDVRQRELTKLVVYLRWRIVASFLWPITPIIMTLCTFATYTLLEGKAFDAATAFTALSLLTILRFPLAVLPNVINSAVEATVSLKRIVAFLLSEEINTLLIEDMPLEENDTALKAKGNFYWDDNCEHVALKNIDLEFKNNEMVIVTGKVGSGKTALLKLFVNDLCAKEGTDYEVKVGGPIAYSNQVPWIQNATVKNNILFGRPFEAEWYDRVVFSCALLSDFDQLTFGDETEIGERGINLSGGQKARIALARAIYSRNKILLLESCFEAVDEHVGDHIWKHCFMDLLYKKRTVICVTHALKRLKHVDSIIVMNHGEVTGRGTFSELEASNNQDFEDLIDAHEKQKASQAEEKEKSKSETATKAKAKDDDSDHLATSAHKKKVKHEENDLTGKEERGVGQVSLDVYRNYINAGGGFCSIFVMMFSFICKVALDFLTNRWLAYWSSHQSKPSANDFLLANSFNIYSEYVHDFSHPNLTTHTLNDEVISVKFFLTVYSILSLLAMVFIVASLVIVMFAGYKASKSIHIQLVYQICRAPMSFFDTTPTGRILNRFSKDIYTLDEILPYTLLSLLNTTFAVIGTFFSIAYVAPQFLIVLPFLAVFYRYIQKYYIASSRELKRWDSVLRSPIYSYFTETLEGTSTIRAFKRQSDFTVTNFKQVARNQRAYYLSVAANRWLAVRLEFVGTFLRVFAALFVVLGKGKLDPGLAGLALTYGFGITQTLNWTVRMFSDMETNIVSVERLMEYLAIASEAPEEKKIIIKDNWPPQGKIEFNDVRARYRDGLPLVLRGLDFVIEAGEKVGIVGRTGAGKSSLFLVLMRLVEPCGGSVVVDGIDLQKLGLLQLRQKIAIIPQDPVMFSGTIKENLDPTNSFKDEAIVSALKLCKIHEHLITMVEQDENAKLLKTQYPELSVELAESGSNLSFGQRQLICIARAVLRDCKILLLDEATSGIDLSTDSIIQETIRNEFKDKTVLTVAHRIETILNGDKVLVMEEGLVKEFDAPSKLLDNPDSMFSELVERMKSKEEN